jgi:hypothetical protein
MLSPETWLQDVLMVVAGVGFIGGIIYLGVPTNNKPANEKMFYGQQFYESDLEGTSGKVETLAVACDLTTTITGDLFADGFVPYETSTIADVKKNVFVMTFWKRVDMNGYQMIITRTDAQGATCIISVSNNVQKIVPPAVENESDGETRDTLDGSVPV